MLKKFQKLAVILLMFFSETSYSNAQQANEDQEREARELIRQLNNIQSMIDEGMGRESRRNDDELDEMYEQYKGVQVEIVQREDQNYYYYELTFIGLREEIIFDVKKDVIRFSSQNKNFDPQNPSSPFYYAFQILHPNPNKMAQVTRNGNKVTIKVPKISHQHRRQNR